jgi:hypothetical protein
MSSKDPTTVSNIHIQSDQHFVFYLLNQSTKDKKEHITSNPISIQLICFSFFSHWIS